MSNKSTPPVSQAIYSAVSQRIRNSDGGFPHDILIKELGENAAIAVYGLYLTGCIGISNDGYCYAK